MKLSVVIPASGRQDLLITCLDSLRQDADPSIDCEICVVDDGSGLDADVIRARFVTGHGFIWKSFSSPKGRSAARNKGVRSTSGDIVIFLDSDMEVRPGFLRAHHDTHAANPGSAVIGLIEWPQTGAFHRYIGSRGVWKLASGDTVPPWYFVTGNASVRRADLPDQEHPFDESLPGWGGEDLALGLALKDNGVTFVHAPGASSFHHFDGDLRGHMRRTKSYGHHVLPILIARRPELEMVLHLDLLESPLWRFLVSAPVRVPVYHAARLLDFLPLPSPVFDYLTFAAYANGYGKRT